MTVEQRIEQIAHEEHTDPMRRIDLTIKLVNLVGLVWKEAAERVLPSIEKRDKEPTQCS